MEPESAKSSIDKPRILRIAWEKQEGFIPYDHRDDHGDDQEGDPDYNSRGPNFDILDQRDGIR
jgi:hypothetical protein